MKCNVIREGSLSEYFSSCPQDSSSFHSIIAIHQFKDSNSHFPNLSLSLFPSFISWIWTTTIIVIIIQRERDTLLSLVNVSFLPFQIQFCTILLWNEKRTLMLMMMGMKMTFCVRIGFWLQYFSTFPHFVLILPFRLSKLQSLFPFFLLFLSWILKIVMWKEKRRMKVGLKISSLEIALFSTAIDWLSH